MLFSRHRCVCVHFVIMGCVWLGFVMHFTQRTLGQHIEIIQILFGGLES